MFKLTACALALAAVSTLAACKTDPEAKANELFVKSVPMWKEAQGLVALDKATLERKISLYQQVTSNFDKIVADYPSSGLAVQLVSGGAVKDIDRKQIDAQLAEAKAQLECLSQQAQCLIRKIEADLAKIEPGLSRINVTAQLAVLHARTGNRDAAARYLTESIAGKARLADQADPQAEDGIIAALVLLGRASEADARIAKFGTGATLGYYMPEIARARYDFGDIEGAVGLLNNPKFVDIRTSLAIVLLGRLIEDGKTEHVLKFLDDDDNKDYRDRYLPALVAHYLGNGQALKAEEILNKYPSDPGKKDRAAIMSLAYAKTGDYDQSLAYYRKSATQNHRILLPELAYTAAKAGNMPAAKVHLAEISRISAVPTKDSEFIEAEKILLSSLMAGDDGTVAKVLAAPLNEYFIGQLAGEAMGYQGKSEQLASNFEAGGDMMRLSGFIKGATEKNPPDIDSIRKALEKIPADDSAAQSIAVRQLIEFGLTTLAANLIEKQSDPTLKAGLAALVANAYLDAATAARDKS